jgi:anaerobic ribonucleoside-triphosphate reductase activating protein
MKIRLNKAHFPVTVLGPGRRIGIWFQGCSIGCAGCISRDTWHTDSSHLIELDSLLEWCRKFGEDGMSGITISGGEPFEQPEILLALLQELHIWRRESKLSFDILCFSGLRYIRLKKDFHEILALLDAVISEPFIKRRRQDRIWRGSSNQTLISLSDLGAARYATYIEAPSQEVDRIQISITEEAIWYIGIPDRDHMEQVEKASQKRGVLMGEVSWRA